MIKNSVTYLFKLLSEMGLFPTLSTSPVIKNFDMSLHFSSKMVSLHNTFFFKKTVIAVFGDI